VYQTGSYDCARHSIKLSLISFKVLVCEDFLSCSVSVEKDSKSEHEGSNGGEDGCAVSGHGGSTIISGLVGVGLGLINFGLIIFDIFFNGGLCHPRERLSGSVHLDAALVVGNETGSGGADGDLGNTGGASGHAEHPHGGGVLAVGWVDGPETDGVSRLVRVRGTRGQNEGVEGFGAKGLVFRGSDFTHVLCEIAVLHFEACSIIALNLGGEALHLGAGIGLVLGDSHEPDSGV